jgi:regulator of RNase E activity RraA
MKNSIVEYIRQNKISSVEISDALSKKGVIDGLKALNDGHFVVGEIEYIYTFNDSNWELHKQIEKIEKNRVVFIDVFNCSNHAVLGDIVSKYLMLYKNSKAIVVNGMVRDVHRLKKEDYPIWSSGYTPLGCFNKEVKINNEILKKVEEQKQKMVNSILVADDSGCTLIEQKNMTEEFLNKLEFIELQEDIWYFCIDTLKMSTYETICLKQYLENEKKILPSVLKEKLKDFESKFKNLKI